MKDFSYIEPYLKGADNFILPFAIELAQKFGHKKSVPYLVDILEKCEPEVKALAIRALAGIEGEDSLPIIEPYLTYDNESVKCVVYDALLKLKPKNAETILSNMLDDLSPAVKAAAFARVKETKSEAVHNKAKEELKKLLASSSEDDVFFALQGLENFNPGEMEIDADFVNKLTQSPNEKLRWSAAVVLGKIKNNSSIPYLGNLLKDRSFRVRAAAVNSLAEYGASAVFEAAKHIKSHNKEEVECAFRALKLINTPVSKKILIDYVNFLLEQAIIDLGRFAEENNQYEHLSFAFRDNFIRTITYGFDFYKFTFGEDIIKDMERDLWRGKTEARLASVKSVTGLGATAISKKFIFLLENFLRLGKKVYDLNYDVAPIADFLLHPYPWVRAWCIYYSAELQDKSLRSEIKQLTEDEDEIVRATAQDIISSYQGRAMKEGGIKIMKDIILLKKIPLFMHLTLEQLKAMSEIMEERTYNVGDIIFEEGAPAGDFYCIVRGKVQVVKKDAAGHSIILTELGEERYFGEMALFDDHPRSATVIAVEETLVYKMSRDNFINIIYDKPDIAIEMCKYLSQKLREKEEKALGRR